MSDFGFWILDFEPLIHADKSLFYLRVSAVAILER